MRHAVWAILIVAGAAMGDEPELGDPKIDSGSFAGQASFVPWSGSWWPMKDGALGLGWNGKKTYVYNATTKKFELQTSVEANDRSPLAKYDEYVRRKTGSDPGAALFELTGDHHVYGDRKKKLDDQKVDYSWWGHCNGWAAAAAMEAEPFAPVEAQGIRFDVADLKGLLAESYYGVYADFVGTRYEKPGAKEEASYKRALELLDALKASKPPAASEYRKWYEEATKDKLWTDKTPSWYREHLEEYLQGYKEEYLEAFEDLRPDVFHKILVTIIGKQRGVVVFDTSANEEVWNYPAYRYETTLADKGVKKIGKYPRRVFEVKTTVHFADDGVSESILGIASFSRTYTYELHTTPVTRRLRGGKWLGGSVDNHPDFAWFPRVNPTGVDWEENPRLIFSRILEILPTRHEAGQAKGFELFANGVASSSRRSQSPITWGDAVDVTGTLALSVTSSLQNLHTVKVFEEAVTFSGSSEVTASRQALAPLGAGMTLPVTLAKGRHMIVAAAYDGTGRLLALDEIAVNVK